MSIAMIRNLGGVEKKSKVYVKDWGYGNIDRTVTSKKGMIFISVMSSTSGTASYPTVTKNGETVGANYMNAIDKNRKGAIYGFNVDEGDVVKSSGATSNIFIEVEGLSDNYVICDGTYAQYADGSPTVSLTVEYDGYAIGLGNGISGASVSLSEYNPYMTVNDELITKNTYYKPGSPSNVHSCITLSKVNFGDVVKQITNISPNNWAGASSGIFLLKKR